MDGLALLLEAVEQRIAYVSAIEQFAISMVERPLTLVPMACGH